MGPLPQRREYLGIYDRCEGGLYDEVGGLYAGRFAYAAYIPMLTSGITTVPLHCYCCQVRLARRPFQDDVACGQWLLACQLVESALCPV